MKKILLTILLCAFSPTVYAASLYSDDVPPVPPDFVIPVSIFVDTEGEEINTISGRLSFGENITVNEVHTGDSLISFWIEPPVSTGEDIRFSGVVPGGFSGNRGRILTLVLSAATPGGTVALHDGLVFLNDGNGTARSIPSFQQNIVVAEDAEPLIAPAQDVVPPEPFSIVKESDPELFGGDTFIAFHAQDKQSGIDYYEVAETDGQEPREDAWLVAESPYHLRDQSGASHVFVKAVDRAGNTRIVSFAPDHPQEEGLATFILYGLLVLVGVGILMRFYKINRKR